MSCNGAFWNEQLRSILSSVRQHTSASLCEQVDKLIRNLDNQSVWNDVGRRLEKAGTQGTLVKDDSRLVSLIREFCWRPGNEDRKSNCYLPALGFCFKVSSVQHGYSLRYGHRLYIESV